MIASIQAYQWVLLWLGLIAAVALAGLYSAMETGVYVMNKIRLDLRAEAGSRPAKRLSGMMKNSANLLAVLLIGSNTWEYVATFVISTMFFLSGAGQYSEWYTLAIGAPVFFILAESVPKNVAQRMGDRLIYRLSWLLWISSVVYNVLGLALLVRGFARLLGLAKPAKGRSPMAHEGIAALVAEGQASGLLTHFQSIMADRIMHIAQVRLRNVMIPMAKVATAPAGVGRQDIMDLLRNTSYSRLPVVDASRQVVGVLDLYDVLNAPGDASPQSMMTGPLTLDENMIVTDALYQMQKTRNMMAVIVNRTGKHIGIATIKDIVEEIVGELEAW